jgi:hypothetical protein
LKQFLNLIGEDLTDHTSRDERVVLHGRERKQTYFRKEEAAPLARMGDHAEDPRLREDRQPEGELPDQGGGVPGGLQVVSARV